jgi:hypothetical protein
VSADELNDLALLQAHRTFNQPATIRNGPVRSDDGVIAIGWSFDLGFYGQRRHCEFAQRTFE